MRYNHWLTSHEIQKSLIKIKECLFLTKRPSLLSWTRPNDYDGYRKIFCGFLKTPHICQYNDDDYICLQCPLLLKIATNLNVFFSTHFLKDIPENVRLWAIKTNQARTTVHTIRGVPVPSLLQAMGGNSRILSVRIGKCLMIQCRTNMKSCEYKALLPEMELVES